MSNPQIKHAVELAEQWAITLDRMADDARIIARRLAALDVPPPEPPKPDPPREEDPPREDDRPGDDPPRGDVVIPDDLIRWG